MTPRSDTLADAILALLDDEAADYTQEETFYALSKVTARELVIQRLDADDYIRLMLRPMVEQARHAAVDLAPPPQDRKAGRGEA